MKNKVLLFFLKLNIFYPWLLGVKFFLYRKNRLEKNRQSFNQSSELLNVVNRAIMEVPYYRDKYNSPISSLEEFNSKIELIDKETVMDNWDSFLLPNYNKSKTVEGTTGGTSGKPLRLVLPKDRYVFELATMYSMWNVLDWKGEARAILRNAKFNTINSQSSTSCSRF